MIFNDLEQGVIYDPPASKRRIPMYNYDKPNEEYAATIRAIGNGVIIKHNGEEVFYDPSNEDDMGYLADFLSGL